MNDIEQTDPELETATSYFERGFMDGIECRNTKSTASEWYDLGFTQGLKASRFHAETTKPEKHRACDAAVNRQFATPY